MKTIIAKKNNNKYFEALLAVMLLMLIMPNEILAQGTGTVNFQGSNSELTPYLKAGWTVVQVILGVLCLVLIITIVVGMVQSGDQRAAGQKAVVLVIVLILWAAIPQIASFFGLTIR
ncbi:MAG: hypothetical protein IM631_13140 [Cytophagales bacterium]|nr:hypothetical protein [Cytophagales bacterium]MCA6372318.1 hypothetical protein [Cytophagales bacterium]MCA6382464.1 hypothetical protein [Cytophagales bacterium]